MGIETSALLAYSAMGSAALGAGAAIYSGQQQKSIASANAAQAQADADAAAGKSQVEAQKIRFAARRQRGAAVSALASSGVSWWAAVAIMSCPACGWRSRTPPVA